MSLYDFLLALGFWQWCGVLLLAFMAAAGIVDGVNAIARALRRKP